MAIEDFGKKIGGARKDLWKSRGLSIDDIVDFNTAEKAKYITKDNIWPKLNYKKMLNEEGYDRDALYFIKTVRDALPAKPELRYSDTEEDIQEKHEVYINFISAFKEDLLAVKTKEDIKNINIDYLIEGGHVIPPASKWAHYDVDPVSRVFITSKFFKSLQMTAEEAHREANKKGFLNTEVKGITAQYSINSVNDRYSVEIYRETGYVKDADGKMMRDENGDYIRAEMEKVRIKQDRGFGSCTYFYPVSTEVENALKGMSHNFGFTYSGNYLILDPNNRIMGMSHDKAEAEQLLERAALKILGRIEEQKAKEAETKEPAQRKQNLIPPILAHIKRTGPETHVENITGQDFIDTFKIPGGEFGNWLNEAERQTNLNMAFDSLKDIAKALNIRDEDIALNGKLSIAFGSRGVKGAAAHYEPVREVINLTKMKGAGSLAHEYFHAMDDIYGKNAGLPGFMTEKGHGDDAFVQLIRALKYKTIEMSPEELKKEVDEKCAATVEKFKKEIIKMVPDNTLTPDLISQRDKLIDDLVEKAKTPGMEFREIEFTKRKTIKYTIKQDTIKDICSFIDTNSKFYKMNAHNQSWLCQQLETVQSASAKAYMDIENKPVTKTVETDFYKNAKQLDEAYSKTNNGYWHSNVEMAARAFACYLYDKMKEIGISNNYLTGHAFSAGVNDKGEALPTYPRIEERAAINKAFDKVIEAMKERGIFHDRVETELAVETTKGYAYVKTTEEGHDFSVMDKDFKEIESGRFSLNCTTREALKAAAKDIEIVKELEPSVFEAKKEQRQEEIIREKQQKALVAALDIPMIDPSSYEQMSFDDMLQQAKEESKGNKMENEKEKQKEAPAKDNKNQIER